MNYECERAMKLTIPSVRIAVAKMLKKEHEWSETDIAKALGVAQPAVSKYMTGNYAPELNVIVDRIISDGLHAQIVGMILKKAGTERVNALIDKVSSDKRLLDLALHKQ